MINNSARRFVCLLVAAALAIATVWMSGSMNAGMAGSHPAATAVADNMMCPDCDTMKVAVSSCTQMSCVSSAVIDEGGAFIEVLGQAFFRVPVLVPDEMTLVPPTPPI